MCVQHWALRGFFLVAAGAHYPRTMPCANHSLSSQFWAGRWALQGSSSPDWRGVEGVGWGRSWEGSGLAPRNCLDLTSTHQPCLWATLSAVTGGAGSPGSAHELQIITCQLQRQWLWAGWVFDAFFFLSSNLVLYNLSSPIQACDWPVLPAVVTE